MKFTITINTDNAAFDDGERGSETARILRAIASHIDGEPVAEPTFYATIHDINGNDVGRWAFKADDYK